MPDRLFDGFTTDEVQAFFALTSLVAAIISDCAPGNVNFTVMSDQQLHLRTEGFTVIIKHPAGKTLVATVHHNAAYPDYLPLARDVAARLGAEMV